MKKVIKTIIIVLAVLVAINGFVAWKRHSADFKKYDPIFVDHFSNDDVDSIHVSSLVAHYYNDHYYYTVTFTRDGDDFVYELLYVFRYENMDVFFSLKDEAECYTYFPTDYENYLKAKAEGIEKIYSSKEIADMINDFYGRTIYKA